MCFGKQISGLAGFFYHFESPGGNLPQKQSINQSIKCSMVNQSIDGLDINSIHANISKLVESRRKLTSPWMGESKHRLRLIQNFKVIHIEAVDMLAKPHRRLREQLIQLRTGDRAKIRRIRLRNGTLPFPSEISPVPPDIPATIRCPQIHPEVRSKAGPAAPAVSTASYPARQSSHPPPSSRTDISPPTTRPSEDSFPAHKCETSRLNHVPHWGERWRAVRDRIPPRRPTNTSGTSEKDCRLPMYWRIAVS